MLCARLAWSAAGSETRRIAHIEAHRTFLRSGVLDVVHSGPLFDADGVQIGALVVAEAADIETMRRLCAEDPFALHGVYDRMQFVEWRITAGRSL